MADATTKKVGIFRKAGRFFKEVKIELKKVTWPTKKQAIKNVLIVLAFLVVISLFVFGIDALFTWINGLVF